MIESNVGYPIIIFYLMALLILSILYHKKLKLFFSIIFSLTVISFNTSLWELPIMLTGPINISSFTTGLVYFIPLPIFALIYNIRFTFNKKSISLLILSLSTSILYGLLLPQSLYAQIGQYYSLGYLTTFIPRIVSLITVTYLFYPNVTKTKFNINHNV